MLRPTALPRTLLCVALAASLLIAGTLPRPDIAHAATFNVTTTTDAPHTTPVDGNCTSTLPGSVCTLRAAIQAADFLTGGPHTINLQAAGTYTLTVTGANEDNSATGDLDLNLATINLVNTSGGAITIDGNGSDRVFDIGPSRPAQLTLSSISIQNGRVTGPGGGIRVGTGSSLSASNLTISGNTSIGNDGGGVSNSGTVLMTNVTSSGNSAQRSGGGLASPGAASIVGGSFTGNAASQSGGGGGAIFSGSAPVSLTNVVISGNTAPNGVGGGIAHLGSSTLTITTSNIANNSAFFSGGGIHSSGATIINSSTISGNNAQDGAGIASSGQLTLATVLVNGNSASRHGGGLDILGVGSADVSNTTLSNNTAINGGGVALFVGTLTLMNSTINANVATGFGGGLHLDALGQLTTASNLINMTVSGNSAQTGGGISVGASSVTTTNVTVSSNTATTGGGVNLGSGSLSTGGTIIASSPQGGNCGGTGLLVTRGFNISGDASCTLTGPGDRINTNPQLGPLADNGGPTLTHALLPGSPAIDAISPLVCPPPATDQRGFVRPAGAACDVGAFELGALPATATPTVTSTATVTATPTSGLPPGATPTPTLPAGTLTPGPTSTPSGGATPTPGSLTVQQAIALVRPSGQASAPFVSPVGQAFPVTGAVTGSGRATTAGTTWTLTATVPAGTPAGIVPVAVISTTQGLQGFTCAAVAAGAVSVTCTGTTPGTPLSGSVMTVVFTPSLTSAGSVAPATTAVSAVGSLPVPPLPPPPPPPPPLPPPPLLPPVIVEIGAGPGPSGGPPGPTPTPTPATTGGAADSSVVQGRIQELQAQVAALTSQLARSERQASDDRLQQLQERGEMQAAIREQHERLDVLTELLGRFAPAAAGAIGPGEGGEPGQ